MASVVGFDESNVGVGKNFGPRRRRDADEGIVSSVKDKCRDSDFIYNIGCGSTGIIIRGTGETRVEGGDFVVEVAQGADTSKTTNVEFSGK